MLFRSEEPALTSSAGDVGSTTNVNSVASEASRDFIALLLSVKSIKLNDGILSDQAFLSLKDTTIVIVQNEDEGRQNPFAPIGSESLTSFTSNISNSENVDFSNNTITPQKTTTTPKKTSSSGNTPKDTTSTTLLPVISDNTSSNQNIPDPNTDSGLIDPNLDTLDPELLNPELYDLGPADDLSLFQIGRASCRERV